MKQLNHELTDLLNNEIKDQKSILGISISTHGGTHIVSELKEEIQMTKSELSAASSSLVFLSSKMLSDSLNQKSSYTLITGKKRIILSGAEKYGIYTSAAEKRRSRGRNSGQDHNRIRRQ